MTTELPGEPRPPGRRPRRMRRIVTVLGALALVMGLTGLCQAGGWMSRADCGQWDVVFDGYGQATCDDGLLRLSPKSATVADRTHAGLATSTSARIEQNTTQTISTTMTTVEQLRENDQPNTWEVAWLLWSYTDNNHFYALVLKPNGWEVSKQDTDYPGYQRFLASGDTPAFPTGRSYEASVRVETTGSRAVFTITVDGQELATVTDTDSPYLSGAAAAYCEDAVVTFTPITRTEE